MYPILVVLPNFCQISQPLRTLGSVYEGTSMQLQTYTLTLIYNIYITHMSVCVYMAPSRI